MAETKEEKVGEVLVAVTGGRDTIPDLKDAVWLERKLKTLRATRLLHGGCRGVDVWAAHVAHSLGIPTRETPADWKKYGGAAGAIRNGELLKDADFLLAWPGEWETADCIRQADATGVPIYRRDAS